MSEDIAERIAGWCAEEPDLDLTGNEIVVEGDPPVRLAVSVEDDRVMLTHVHSTEVTSGDFADAARRLLTRRGSMVRGTVDASDEGVTTTVEYRVYRDGISRQNFLLAVRDVAGTADALDRTVAELGGAVGAGVGEATGEAPEAPEPAQPEAAQGAEPAAPVESTEELEPAAVPAAPWAPTHAVPAGGMDAWAEPDPSQAPVAALQGRVELRVDEERGAWARVTGSNGWTGWVDGRRLLALGGGAAAGTGAGKRAGRAGFGVMQAGGMSVLVLPLLGGIALIVSALLPWESFSQIGLDVKPFDLPLAVLWGEGSPTQPELGLALVVIGIAAFVSAIIPGLPRRVFVFLGILGAACAILFFVQLGRAAGWKLDDVFEILGIGFWIAFAGGILTTIGGEPAEVRR